MTLPLFPTLTSVPRLTMASAADQARDFYPTPFWLAEAIVGKYFGDLDRDDLVLDAACGEGRLMRALPAHVPAVGVESDPALAEMARRLTGRPILTGDILTIPLAFRPTMVISNPPFRLDFVAALLARCHTLLPADGRVGLLLPATILATSRTVMRFARDWGIQQEMIPRDTFVRLSQPLVFAVFSKSRRRSLVGFAFYEETAGIRELPRATQALLADPPGSAWWSVVSAAMTQLGGEADLATVYEMIAPHRPTANPFWRDRVRAVLQERTIRVRRGRYRLAVA